MMNFFEHCADIASVGIIVDFTEDTETYIVGSPADIKTWAYSGCPRKAPTGIMWHSNKLGNLVKDIQAILEEITLKILKAMETLTTMNLV